MIILEPWTEWWAQRSYDHIKEEGVRNDQELLAHLYFQSANVGAHTIPSIYMITSANPHVMSYAYAGISAEKYGIAAATADRKAFQMASSKAYQSGEAIGRRFGGRKAARIGGRIATKMIPGVGWALLAYDAYDLIANRRLFGVQL